MRKISIVIVLCSIVSLATLAQSQARDLDTIMKEIQRVWQTPGTGLGARGSGLSAPRPDYSKIAADAAKLQALFAETAAEFTKLKMSEPAGIAKSASDAAGALAREARTGKIADVKATQDAIGQCRVCHDPVTGYREPDGNGGFKVRGR